MTLQLPLEISQKRADLHRRVQRLAYNQYLRWGRIPEQIQAIVDMTQTDEALCKGLGFGGFGLGGRGFDEDFEAKYSPDQPRAPRGSSDGGQWVSGGGGTGSRPGSGSGGSGRSPAATATNHRDRVRVTDKNAREVQIYHLDGSLEVRQGRSIAWRNNNPGNLRATPFAYQQGAIGSAGGFAVFPDENTGRAASIALLQTSTYSRLTIDEAIARRSPANENDTINLQGLIHKIGGFTGKEKVGALNQSQLESLARAIQRTEGWNEGSVRKKPKN